MQNKLPFAGTKKLNQVSGMPQMDTALSGWGMPITLTKIIQSIVDGDKVEEKVNVEFLGVDQPLKGQELLLKPEGQRDWEWRYIHDYYGILELKAGDKIIRTNGILYKVILVNDYSLNNYMEYHIVNDFTESE